jgi:hypothetical protein
MVLCLQRGRFSSSEEEYGMRRVGRTGGSGWCSRGRRATVVEDMQSRAPSLVRRLESSVERCAASGAGGSVEDD